MRLHFTIFIAFSMSATLPLMAADQNFSLTAAATQWEVAPGQRIAAYTYNGTVPGPELRVTEGDAVRITLTNRLPEPTTIHWHGVPVPNGMDGVPGISAPVIAPGQSFTYVFTAPAAGTYWYHPHAHSATQIARGLYGLLVVDSADHSNSGYDREVSLIIGESMMTMMNNGGGMMGGGMGSTATGMMDGLLLINGKTGPYVPDLVLRRGERVLFRMVNTGNMVHPMHVHGLHWTVTATDGYPLAAPYRKDTLPINAGERYDAILVADNPGIWMLHCHNLLHVGDDQQGLSMRVIVTSP